MTLKSLTILIFFFCVTLISVAQPKLEVYINKIFNDNWKFTLSDSALYSEVELDDSAWRLLNLPTENKF